MRWITPACAGRSALSPCLLSAISDHPRVRGEKWGYVLNDTDKTRITPACAGRRYKADRFTSRSSDHPRVRGEKMVPPDACFVTYGSPPRARGEVFAR